MHFFKSLEQGKALQDLICCLNKLQCLFKPDINGKTILGQIFPNSCCITCQLSMFAHFIQKNCKEMLLFAFLLL